MTIHCNHCDAINTKPVQANTLNGRNEVCPDCYSEDIRHVRTADDALDAMLNSIRRNTMARVFYLNMGGQL